MKQLAMSPWDYELVERGDDLVFTVWTGGVAGYDFPIVLNAEETAVWTTRGEAGLADLALHVRAHLTELEPRRIEPLDAL